MTNDSDSGSQLVFVGGAPRSGTTLVQNMLDSHPQIFGGPEFLHLPDIVALRERLRASASRGLLDGICTDADIDRQCRTMIEGFLLPLLEKHGARLVSEKTPRNVLVFSELADLLPRARFIHVVRDPRAVIASLLQVGRRAREKKTLRTPAYTQGFAPAAYCVRQCLQAGFDAARRAPARCLTLVYEDLVRAPEEQTRRLCEFLELEWSSRMLTPASQIHSGEKASTVHDDDLWYDVKNFYRNPDLGSLNKWKTSLTPSQQLAICKTFRDNRNLAPLGYDFSLNGLSPLNRWRGRVGEAANGGRESLIRAVSGASRRTLRVLDRNKTYRVSALKKQR